MKTKYKFILGTLVILLGVVIALWPIIKPPEATPGLLSTLDSQPTTFAPAPPQLSPVAKQPLPATTFNTPESPRKKFAAMGVLEERAIVAEIKKQDLPAIFQAMIDAERVEHDDLKQMHLQTTFSNALMKKKPNPEFMEQMYGFLTNRANSDFERHLLIGALKEAATKESVDLLLRVANTAPEKEIRGAAAALSGVASSSMRPSELSPMLERTWQETSNPTLLRSTATAMSRIGTPSGIELLLSAALATDDRDKARQQAAYYALQEAYQSNAVPPLAARLANQPPTSPEVQLVAPILARITDPSASNAVVGWLQGRSENAAPLIHDYIRQRMLGDPFTSAWATALDPSVPFKNEENRKAIREALDAYRAGRTSR